jgi:heme-degrading monooxygenase HmoA
MINRVWYGWTTPGNADAYEALLRDEILVGIAQRELAGFRGFQVLRRERDDDVEFVTIIRFDSLEGVRAFAGQDCETAVVPPKARALLSRFDTRAQHYDVRVDET